MVLGPTHAIQGFGAGLAVALLAPTVLSEPPAIPVMVAFAVVTAGAAIAPDLDHPGATASRSLGPITGLVAWLLHHLSGFVYRHTRTRYDQDRDGTHRGITHTVPGALITAGLVAALCRFAGTWGVTACLFLFALFALRALPPRNSPGFDLVAAAGLAALGWWLLPPVGLTPWIAAAVVLGMVVHCLGDALTLSGVPLLWPLSVRGQRWYPVRTPRAVRFRADGRGDMVVRVLSVLVVLALLVAILGPAAWSWLSTTVAEWRTG
jgi:membrane-bound metal-dependent hydrolase YbcI (DUF457 family)